MLVGTQLEYKIKMSWSDNGREFILRQLNVLEGSGIEQQTSVPYMPQQNKMGECANCTIMEMIKTMLYAQNLHNSFGTETVAYMDYTQNRCSTSVLDFITPKDAWSRRRPCIAHMRVFGCVHNVVK